MIAITAPAMMNAKVTTCSQNHIGDIFTSQLTSSAVPLEWAPAQLPLRASSIWMVNDSGLS